MGGYGQAVQHQQALKDQEKATIAALYLNAIQTPLPKTDDPEYAKALQKREDLMKQYVAAQGPEQHASFGQHLHGLIFGQAPQAEPVHGEAPQPPPASGAPSGTPTPAHPFAHNPVYAKLMEGLEGLGKHIEAGVHPLPKQPGPDYAELAAAPTAEERSQAAALELEKQKEAGALAVAKARGVNTRPIHLGDMTPQDAIKNLKAIPGQQYFDDEGNEISQSILEEAPPYMKLEAYRQGGTTFYKLVDERTKTRDIGGQVYQINELGELKPESGSTDSLGVSKTPTEKKSVDQFGNVATSESTPATPGMTAAPTPAPPSAEPTLKTRPVSSQAPSLGDANRAALQTKLNSKKPISKQAPTLPGQLDASGHIPDGVANPQVTEAANQLLDGVDKDKLPMKAREPAAMLARHYGWLQGTFTPKERVLLRESSTFLDEAANNPALSVLDNVGSRLRLSQLIGDATKKGTVGKLVTIAASAGSTPQEQEFLRMYNQLVGTISGLGQLTRSGRVTEATIGRLMQELPNPLTTQSSADAKSRLARLKQELTVAQQTGNLGGASPVSSQAPNVSDATAPRPPGVPENYVHKNGPQGSGWYAPTQ